MSLRLCLKRVSEKETLRIGSWQTLLDLMQFIVPHHVPCIQSCSPHDLLSMKSHTNQVQGVIVLHGVVPSLDVPLAWLSEHASYADGFLHLVLL